MSLFNLITEQDMFSGVLNIVSSLPFLIVNDDMTSHTVYGATANIGFAGNTVHSCT